MTIYMIMMKDKKMINSDHAGRPLNRGLFELGIRLCKEEEFRLRKERIKEANFLYNMCLLKEKFEAKKEGCNV